MFKKVAIQFCLSTGLHGYRFIVLRKRILLERCIWVVICLISIVTALTLLSMAWLEYSQNPVVTVTDSNDHSIWHYPFPSVTICNINIISKKGAIRLAERLGKSSTDKEILNTIKNLMYLIHYNVANENYFENLTYLQNLFDENYLTINTAMSILTTRCEDILLKCTWKEEEKRCESIFETISTSYGFCCSFNYYAVKNHSLHGTMASKTPKEPMRVSACGYLTGLEVLVENEQSDYFASLIPSIGHQIMIHSPYDYPDWNSKSSLIPIKTINFIGIEPRCTYSEKSVSNIPIENRMCWFPHENQLYYFTQYSFHNCIIECRMNLTLELCQCVPFFYVPHDGVNKILGRICNLRDIPCLFINSNLIISSVPGYNFSNLEPNRTYGNEKRICNCFPDCLLTDYFIKAVDKRLSRKFALNHHSLYEGLKVLNRSLIRVYFNDLVGTRVRRSVRFNWHTLLGFYGGLLGLFMGFSFVSAIETIFFFIVTCYNYINKIKLDQARINKTKKKKTRQGKIKKF